MSMDVPTVNGVMEIDRDNWRGRERIDMTTYGPRLNILPVGKCLRPLPKTCFDPRTYVRAAKLNRGAS